MKQKNRPHLAAVVVVGVLLAAGQLAVQLWGLDPTTGYAPVPLRWLCCGVWLAALVLPYLPARHCAAQPAALADRCPLLGAGMLLCAALLLAAGAAELAFPTAIEAGYPVYAAVLDAVSPIPAAVWLAGYGLRAFTGCGIRRGSPAPAWVSLVVPFCFLWRLFRQFQQDPVALPRLTYTGRVVTWAAALLFAAVLLKIFATPGLPCGHTLFAAGTACFWLCSCVGPLLVLTVSHTAYELLMQLAAAALGLCGLVCAAAACGEDTE